MIPDSEPASGDCSRVLINVAFGLVGYPKGPRQQIDMRVLTRALARGYLSSMAV